MLFFTLARMILYNYNKYLNMYMYKFIIIHISYNLKVTRRIPVLKGKRFRS